jgi:hypothetical protein
MSIGIIEHTTSILFVALPVSHVSMPIAVLHLSSPLHDTINKVTCNRPAVLTRKYSNYIKISTLVDIAIGPSVNSLAMLDSALHLSCIGFQEY